MLLLLITCSCAQNTGASTNEALKLPGESSDGDYNYSDREVPYYATHAARTSQNYAQVSNSARESSLKPVASIILKYEVYLVVSCGFRSDIMV